jgi:hypothetical protein
MSHLPGQPHFTGTDFGAATHSAHEATVRGHSAPKLETILAEQGIQFLNRSATEPSKKMPSDGRWPSTDNSAVLPETDVFGRRRRSGFEPDTD